MANAATKRLALIGGAVAVVGVGVYLMLSAFNDNLVFFYSPMQVAAKEAPQYCVTNLTSAPGKSQTYEFYGLPDVNN